MVFAWMPTSPHERPTVYHARNRISCTLRKWLQVKLTALSSCAFHSVWHCPNGSRLTPYAPEALMSHGKCLAAIHRFQVNPSPQRHCPASLLARFFQNLKGHSGKYLQDSSWLMSSLVTEHEKTVKNQIAIGTIGSWCSNGITNQHWSISTYHSGRLWFFRSLQPCSSRLPGQAIGLFDLQMSQKAGYVRLYSSVQKCAMHLSCPQLYIPTTSH